MTEQQTLPAERARATVSDDLVWIMDTARFEHMWRIAQAMAAAKEEMARRRLTPAHLSDAASHEMQEALDSVFDLAIVLAEDGRTIAEIQAP